MPQVAYLPTHSLTPNPSRSEVLIPPELAALITPEQEDAIHHLMKCTPGVASGMLAAQVVALDAVFHKLLGKINAGGCGHVENMAPAVTLAVKVQDQCAKAMKRLNETLLTDWYRVLKSKR